uniref:Uncharacterized protein n=1 Tax=Setaria viridis TaxID=4556 RepID=A0A4U6U7I0_SETVI|nr:hypothetical protein SEVIR_6G146600v2 [Setaria viridis]
MGGVIQRTALDRFGSSISLSPSSRSPGFFLVASFDSVSLVLQSCLGGLAIDFNVVYLSGSSFRFTVQSKSIGFMVYNLKFFKFELFAVFFSLWGNGGPNWIKEHDLWLSELVEWAYVQHKNSKKSFADAVRSSPAHRFLLLGNFDHDREHVSAFDHLSSDRSEMAGFQNLNSHPKEKESNQLFLKPTLHNPRNSRLYFRCLSLGHLNVFGYGRISRFCRAKSNRSRIYRRVVPAARPTNDPPAFNSAASSSNVASPSFGGDASPSPDHATAPPSSMSNFPVDPCPHLPNGFHRKRRIAPRKKEG